MASSEITIDTLALRWVQNLVAVWGVRAKKLCASKRKADRIRGEVWAGAATSLSAALSEENLRERRLLVVGPTLAAVIDQLAELRKVTPDELHTHALREGLHALQVNGVGNLTLENRLLGMTVRKVETETHAPE